MQATAIAMTLYADARVRVARDGHLFFAIWHDAPEIEQMEVLTRVLTRGRAEHPEGVACVSVVVGGTPIFSSEVRAAAADLRRQSLANFGMAHVILVGGLVGATVRTFLSTTLLLTRSAEQAKVFDSVQTAAAWLQENMATKSVELDVPRLVSAVEAVIGEGPG